MGLVTLQDPPRKEVPKAIEDCHTAGVKVVMVTGDHPLTAAAIARKIGLITRDTRDVLARKRGVSPQEVPEDEVQAVVVKGADIPAMTEQDWKVLVSKKEIVFARTSPEQKLIIVDEFTKAGNVTAMTGDGMYVCTSVCVMIAKAVLTASMFSFSFFLSLNCITYIHTYIHSPI